MGQEDWSPATQGSRVSPFPRNAAGMDVSRARESEGKGARRNLFLGSLYPAVGLLARKDAWYRYTWDRSLFLIYRRKELQSVMAELDFSQQVASTSVPCLRPLRVAPVFSQLNFPFFVSLRILMA